MNEPLLCKNYPSTKHQNKFFIFRIRRHFPQCRSSRIYIYLFLVFVGVFVLFGLRKRTSFENCDEYSTNSARRIACKKGEDEEREQKTDKEKYSIGDGRRELTLDEIKEKVSEINSLHTVYNSDKFRPLSDDSVIILIQVHKRLENLRELIKSLEKVRGIESSLLVFSHDYYDEDIINFVKEIQFAKFIIIFFPYAVQIHPNEFPGETPGDCPWDLSRLEAEKLKCNMYKHPDYYGHYSQGTITQIKHHWWWKAVSVFEDIEYTKHHKGLVLFLEEDLYVTEDVLHVINLMEEKTEEVCKNCSILFLGSYLEKNAFTNWIPNQVQVENWNSIGFTFNRPLWDQLKDCAEDFCTFDDYNWDWSVRYVFEKCFKNKPSALTVKGSRVFHTGDCGIHHTKKANCNIEDSMKPINNFMELIKDKLFPKQLDFIRSSFTTPKVAKKWGGWADPRDQYMCIKMVNHTLR